jgi:hypothetical protein
MKVYKVVRPDRRGRLVSAILPDHLATVYRTAGGTVRTVMDSLAFHTRHAAEVFARSWTRMDRPLQVWRASATVIPGMQPIVSWVETRDDCLRLFELGERRLNRDTWAKAVEAAAGKTGPAFICVDDITMELSYPPAGSAISRSSSRSQPMESDPVRPAYLITMTDDGGLDITRLTIPDFVPPDISVIYDMFRDTIDKLDRPTVMIHDGMFWSVINRHLDGQHAIGMKPISAVAPPAFASVIVARRGRRVITRILSVSDSPLERLELEPNITQTRLRLEDGRYEAIIEDN